jgi:anti-anti-sigma factor
MPGKTLEASVRNQPSAAIVDLHGEINAFAEDVLNAAYAEAESRGTNIILLNFSDVDYINSTGIALIVSLLARARKNHRRLLAYGLSDHYVEIFRITRLADFMSVFPDEATALGDEPTAVFHPSNNHQPAE